jgi:acyl carrier protein
MDGSKEALQRIVTEALTDLFDVEESAITPESRLYEDLDIDSIDAVDLIVRLKEKTGKKPDPEAFKNVRTVGDIVTAIHTMMHPK